MIQKINESKSWFFEKINKIDKPLTRLIKKKREDPNKQNWNERGKVKTDITEIQSIVRNYCEQLYAKKLDNVGEIDKFLETYNLPKVN